MDEWLRSVDRTVVCPGCAFTFAEDHTDQDGGYSCPVCALDRARSTACLLEGELARVTAENARLREALADPFPTGAYQRWLRGGDDEAADQINAWRERRRAALASPVQEGAEDEPEADCAPFDLVPLDENEVEAW